MKSYEQLVDPVEPPLAFEPLHTYLPMKSYEQLVDPCIFSADAGDPTENAAAIDRLAAKMIR
jgi:hypothetical protein